jgi:hypothetical protein
MAMWAATSGSESGFALFDAWARRNPSYDRELTRKRWEGYHKSPPNRIGAGTIFHLAKEARQAEAKRAKGREEETQKDAAKQNQAETPQLSEGLLEPDTVLNVFNRRYMLVKEAGRVLIFEPRFDPMLKRRYFDRLTINDFKALYLRGKTAQG